MKNISSSAPRVVDASGLIEEIGAAVSAGQWETACEIAEAGLRRGVKHPFLFRIYAFKCEREGRYSAAIGAFNVALSAGIGRDDDATLDTLGVCLSRLGRFEEAFAAFDHALQINPGLVAVHCHRGWALELQGELAMAMEEYERAASLDPNCVEANARMAMAAARRGQRKRARALAGHAVSLEPLEPTAHLALATVEIAEGDGAAAELRLAGLMNARLLREDVKGMAETLLGDALDLQRRPAEAFAAWASANRRFRSLYNQYVRPDREILAVLDDYFRTREGAWPAAVPDARMVVRTHVFIVGFPRSGTTLLGQILAAHPDIEVLDEQVTLTQSSRELMASAAALDRLSRLGEPDLAEHRRRYWSAVGRLGGNPVPDRIFVDKLPMNTLALPLIARLFPEARIVMMQRDPRDVVLGCFRRQFAINSSTYELLDLDDAARYYDATMRLADLYRRFINLAFYDLRYEDLVDEFDARTRSLCNFIGVDWTPSLINFASTGSTVRSVSAAQITRGLYREGAGQWRAYARELAPVLPLLQPWVERFGYTPD